MNASTSETQTKSILLVEDDEPSQNLIRQILKPLQIKIDCVSDGGDAINYIENNPGTNLILMDLKLPYLDGYEATKTIKAMNPEIPVIAQTAFAMAEDRLKAINAGCDDYITKPLDSEKLRVLVEKYTN